MAEEGAMVAIKRVIGGLVAAMALAVSASAQDAEYETRIGPKDFESPPANLDQLDWLVGQWVGEGIRGATAMESWLPPAGGTMVGTFVQETSGGAIQFTEILYLTEEKGTLVLRLKHFNADLTGWEEKDDMLTFRLVAIEDCAAYFNALTLRCADKDNPGAGIVAAVRMRSDKPEPQEMVFTFDALRESRDGWKSCDGTTYSINQCLAAVRDRAKEREAQYFETAIGGNNEVPGRRSAKERMMRSAQASAEQSRKDECGAVYEQWKDGTIRNAMALRCEIRLIDQRTHDIWRNWLIYQDSSKPILPEPGPSK